MSAILRRPEFKRARSRRRNRARRHPMPRVLKGLYGAIFQRLTVPLLDCLQRGKSDKTIHWGGSGAYFDVVISPAFVPATTRLTDAMSAEAVNYAGTARAPLSGADA